MFSGPVENGPQVCLEQVPLGDELTPSSLNLREKIVT